MRKSKLKLSDIKVGMVITYISERNSYVEILSGRVENIEWWFDTGTWRIVLMTGPIEAQSYETIMINENNPDVIVEGVL